MATKKQERWVIDWNVDEAGPRIFPEAGGSSVCRVDRYQDPKTKKELRCVGERARLICAAPDLIQALKDMKELFDRPYFADLDFDGYQDVIEAADDAISKAERGE